MLRIGPQIFGSLPRSYFSHRRVIDGRLIAESIQADLISTVQHLRTKHIIPRLAVILVGQRKDSMSYVLMKKKACQQCGIEYNQYNYTSEVTEDTIIAKVKDLNRDSSVHGILVQLPLPKHIHAGTVLEHILPRKDVDGLHSRNVKNLMSTTHTEKKDNNSNIFHTSCTPQGIMELLEWNGVVIEGKEAVVIGRSNIVGIPTALLLMQRNATVTIAHSKTQNLAEVVKRADIVIVAVGQKELVKASWIKPGAVVIDVGINSVDDSSKKAGYRLIGDVDFAACQEVASLITPVPGGVGPMTIAMLLRNTVNSALHACKINSLPE